MNVGPYRTVAATECATAQAVEELVELIAAQRTFEPAAQAFHTIDQRHRRLYH